MGLKDRKAKKEKSDRLAHKALRENVVPRALRGLKERLA
jgi:hypothetical protein